MRRLNSVKITNFGLENKKSFLTYSKIVFGVTDHVCIKWTFWKNALFCSKNAFLKKMAIGPPAQRQCQGTFFSGGNFRPIFEAKKLGTVGQKCPGHFSSSQFSPKSAIFGGFDKKSFRKWLEPKTYCVGYPNTFLYMVLDHIWAKKCHNFGQKL